ncbi:high affinity cationic amino acid transporter 1-like [Saccoglossus kowalevskii]|uniref:High affinity cationic amino acid transporter 1-like n=1 Tax=Saccoglossus kowalevskii TaxID=10224 RepID=A0ABM0GJD4_SACKO|nr:PREDICTED: high affinity cationic amino acid transporter 1-like [Saccoglossus kowalevskii]
MTICHRFKQRLLRKKYIDFAYIEESNLKRCLDTIDLTALGIGGTLGTGLYVIAGQVGKEVAGPSVVLSFLIAGIASVLSGLCYAEFGARVPRAGSAYVYAYVTVGELWGFVIGWNMILEYVIGSASVARGWSGYFDSMLGENLENFSMKYIPMNMPGIAAYPDFLAFVIVLSVTAILMVGVKESSRFNNVFTSINMVVVLFILVTAVLKANFYYWDIQVEDIPDPETQGDGGFFPFGFSGTMSGAATCFYAFVGFDAIATTGEEVKNPQQAIPVSILLSLTFVFLSYFGVSSALTLLVPYYELDSGAPIPHAFQYIGWEWARYIVTIGAVCGLSTSLLGSMLPLPRVIYAMANDGLVFRYFSRVDDNYRTPLVATAVSGIFAGLMALFFEIKQLVDMMSIGTLLAYTIVSVCVLILRYECDTGKPTLSHLHHPGPDTTPTLLDVLGQCFASNTSTPSELSSSIVTYATSILGALIFMFCSVMIFAESNLAHGEWWAIILAITLGICILVSLYAISKQPQNTRGLTFKAPAVPLLPIISMFINIYLMLKLSYATWIRFSIWMSIGFCIYFGYGIWNSSEELRLKETFANEALNSDDDSDDGAEAVKMNVDKTDNEGAPLLSNMLPIIIESD